MAGPEVDQNGASLQGGGAGTSEGGGAGTSEGGGASTNELDIDEQAQLISAFTEDIKETEAQSCVGDVNQLETPHHEPTVLQSRVDDLNEPDTEPLVSTGTGIDGEVMDIEPFIPDCNRRLGTPCSLVFCCACPVATAAFSTLMLFACLLTYYCGLCAAVKVVNAIRSRKSGLHNISNSADLLATLSERFGYNARPGDLGLPESISSKLSAEKDVSGIFEAVDAVAQDSRADVTNDERTTPDSSNGLTLA